MTSKLGPSAINGTVDARAWAARAPVVKQQSHTDVLQMAHANAIQVYRWPFRDQNLTASPEGVRDAILNGLGGYRHANLHVEVYVGVPGSVWRAHLAFLQRVVPLVHAAGLKVIGPSWYTGDYEAEAWEGFRAAGWAGLDLIGVQAYWSTAGLSPWNALRWRRFWQPGDPYVVVVECGRDQVRDGPNGTLLPKDGAGRYGFQRQGVGDEQAITELVAYDAELAKGAECVGALPFVCGPTDDWRDSGFDLDPIAGRLAAMSTPRSAPFTTPAPRPTKPTEPTMPNNWCPFATARPIPGNFWPDRDGQTVKAIVDHVADGSGSLFGWFSNPAAEVSAHFWVGRDGSIEQYVPLAAAAWANGPLNNPNLAVPLIAWCKQTGTNPNRVTVSIEHEGKPADGLAPAQTASSRKLHLWLSEVLGIPLDRQHVLGHYQFDSVTRSNCPGPKFPWEAITVPDPAPAPKPDVTKLRDQAWSIGEQFEKAGQPWTGQAIKAAVALSKGEK